TKSKSNSVIEWYLTHEKHAGDYLIFVNAIKPNTITKQFSLPMLLGTTLKISGKSVKDGRHACRDAMRLAKKNDIQAHAYLYVDPDVDVALAKSIRELKPDLVLMNGPKCTALQSKNAKTTINYPKAVCSCKCNFCSPPRRP
ncbi:hypothetical protein X801_10443, partial [Opisthorchis viverrini]